MRRVLLTAALLAVSLVSAPVVLAGVYAGPQQWSPGQGAGSSYSATWHENDFAMYGSGADKAVTFIDNKTYSWHNTVRNTSGTTKAYDPYPLTVKAHCVSYSYFTGTCNVF
jgi:hypothetical protein